MLISTIITRISAQMPLSWNCRKKYNSP